MSTQVQFRRGTTAQHSTFTGAVGEITVDTTLKTIRVHDGSTPGGTVILSTASSIAARITDTTESVSTNTGALTVAGGVGIGGNLHVGGEIVASKLTVQLTTVTTTNVTTDDIITTENATSVHSTNSGALRVTGGVGVGGGGFFGGVVTATNFVGNLTGNVTGNLTGNADTATSAGRWTTPRTFTFGGDLSGSMVVDGSQNVTFTATIAADSVALGTDTTGNYVATAATSGYGLSGSANSEGSTFTVTANSTSANTVSTIVFRDGNGDFSAGTITATGFNGPVIGTATTSTNIANGGAGQIPIQSAAGITTFIPAGTSGQFLQAGTNTATFVNTSTMYVNSSVFTEDVRGGTAGQLVYQSAANTTDFVGPGTAGQILVSAGATAPVYTNTASIYVNSAVNAETVRAGTAGQLLYQSSPGVTAFAGPGTAGQLLMSAGAAAPVYTNTSSIYVNTAVFAEDLKGGAAGSLPYQSAADTTVFLAGGANGNNLRYFNNAPVWSTTASFSGGTASASAVAAQSLLVTAGGAGVTGNSYFANDLGVGGNETITGTLTVSSTNANTGTNTSNAIYTAGGAWIDKSLVVGGTSIFQGPVLFQGTSTFVYSTQTLYSDNLIQIHAPSGATPVSHTWTLDDGSDIGHIFHYYKTTDKDAFLGWKNGSTYLEWWENGSESGGVYTGSTWGTFRTGAIKLVGGTANANNTSTGDLTVLGGVGVGGSIYVGGNVTVAGTINASVIGISTTATNITNGTAGQVPYQTAPGATSFFGPGTAGQLLMSAGAAAPVYTNTGSIYVANAVNAEKWLTARTVTFAGGDVTGSFSIDGSANVSNVALTIAADSVALGTDTTGNYVATGATSGFGLSGSASTEGSTFTVTANSTSSNTVGTIVYRDDSGNFSAATITATSFVGPLTGRATSANRWYTPRTFTFGGDLTGSMHVDGGQDVTFTATIAANSVALGTDTTGDYVSNGATSGFGLSGSTTGESQTFTVTANSTSANTVSTIVFRDGSGNFSAGTITATAFSGPITGNVTGSASQLLTTAQTGNATYFLTFVDANNASAAAETVFTTSTFTVNPATGAVSASSLTLTGNLTVQGTTTVVNSTVTNVSDPIVTIGGGAAGAAPTADDNKDRGIAFQWHTGSAAKIGFFGYDDSTGYMTFVPDATITNEVVSGTQGDFQATNFRGTLVGSLSGGAAGNLVYQSAANTTAYLTNGTAGQILLQGATNPTWTNTASVYVNSAVNAEKLFGGTAGQLVYQSGAGTTAFAGPGTAGQVLTSGGTGAPTYVSTSSLYVNRAVTADSASGSAGSVANALTIGTGLSGTAATYNGSAAVTISLNTATLMQSSVNLAGGTAGQLHYQSAANTTAFVGPGTAGQLLMSAGATAPVYTNTASIYVNSAVNAERLFGGTAGQLVYQSGAGTTAFAGPGTAGQILVSAGTSAPTYTNTASIYVGTAVQVDTIAQTANANYFLTFVDTNNATSAREQVCTTSSFLINPSTSRLISGQTAATGGISIGTTSTANKFEVVGNSGQLFSVSDTFTGTIFSVNDISGIPSIEVLDTGLVKIAQYNGQTALSTGTIVGSSGLTVWTTTYILSLGVGTAASGTIGEIRASNEVTAYYSDRRLKENVKVIDNALVKVLSLNGITYTPNAVAESYGYDRTKKLVGFFADEVEAVLPEAVRPAPFDLDDNGNSKSGENYKTIQYEKVVPLLVEAMKEQQKLIDQLTAELAAVKQSIKGMNNGL